MKPSVLITVVAECCLSSLSCFADFDPQKELNCETSDGTKIIVNDALVGGPGKGIAGSIDRVYQVTELADRQTHVVRLTFNFDVRSAAPAYTMDLDLKGAKITSRREGSADPAQYYLVPALVKVESGWDNQPSLAAKCFQPAS